MLMRLMFVAVLFGAVWCTRERRWKSFFLSVPGMDGEEVNNRIFALNIGVVSIVLLCAVALASTSTTHIHSERRKTTEATMSLRCCYVGDRD